MQTLVIDRLPHFQLRIVYSAEYHTLGDIFIVF